MWILFKVSGVHDCQLRVNVICLLMNELLFINFDLTFNCCSIWASKADQDCGVVSKFGRN